MNIIAKNFLIKKQDIIENFDKNFNLKNIQENTYVYGSNSGQLGMIQSIPFAIFEQMDELEKTMNNHIKTIGDFKQSEYRLNDPDEDLNEKYKLLPCHKRTKRFIDGDFLSSFFQCSKELQEVILEEARNVDIKLIEGWIKSLSLTSLH